MYAISCYMWLKNTDRPVSVTIRNNSEGVRFASYNAAKEHRNLFLSEMKDAIDKAKNSDSKFYSPIESLIINTEEISCVYAEIREDR